MRSTVGPGAAVLAVSLLLGCSGEPTAPETGAALSFSIGQVDLGAGRSTDVELVNAGARTTGPVDLTTGPVRDDGGTGIPGSRLRVEPSAVPSLAPGARVPVTLQVELGGTLRPGRYETALWARARPGTPDPVPPARLEVRFRVESSEASIASVEMAVVPATLRQGDVVALTATARDDAGAPLEGTPVVWSVEPPDAGFVGTGGAFVGYRPGPARLIVRDGPASDTAEVTIEPRGLSGSFQVVGAGLERGRYTSDLWVRGSYAYLGTWGIRDGTPGNTLFTWSVADPSAPVLVDSLQVDARTVNDVKVHPTRALAVLTHEASADERNGVTFLDLTDPAHPRPLSRFTRGLETGVHNAWLDGDYAYVAVDGVGSGLHILDVSDPEQPRAVAQWAAATSFLHDVYVRDGLAFLSHWDAGLVILDVGNGLAGGSPEHPVVVSILAGLGGQTHNVWYWPEAGYAFVGEEDFEAPGRLHVVDLRDLRSPVEVATFAVPGDTPHNVWLDEGRAVLYAAWYTRGIRALDVSGELLGDLSRQGREIAGLRYNGGTGSCGDGATTCTWAPQMHAGLLYVSDLDAGLVVLRPTF